MTKPARHRIIEEDLALIAAADLPWHLFEKKTVLISGANGFLPAYMVESLLRRNEVDKSLQVKVIALVRNQKKAFTRFAAYRERHDLEFIVQDVCEPVVTDHKVDYVIHAASPASPKQFGLDPVGTMAANLQGTQNLLRFARDQEAERFLLFSSGEVYGEVSAANIPTKEDAYGYLDPMALRSCYAESKRAAEALCVAWFHQHKVPVVVVRPFHTYGPGMDLEDGRVFSDFVADIVHGRDIVMKSDGSARRAFCYLADATMGFFTVLLKGENGEAYNVGNDQAEVTIMELAHCLARLFPRKTQVIPNAPNQCSTYLPSTVSRNLPDTGKICALGWLPTTSIETGFRRTIESFL
jgi:nucleoside-diphosphate-sugar epimerase